MSRWTRFLALPPRERRLRLRALAVVAGARARLSLRPFPRVRAWARGEGLRGAAAGATAAEIDRAVRSAATFVPRATCLVRALAARRLLAREGIPAGLRLGLAREGGDLDAHAWVECADGSVVGDRGRPDYAAVGI